MPVDSLNQLLKIEAEIRCGLDEKRPHRGEIEVPRFGFYVAALAVTGAFSGVASSTTITSNTLSNTYGYDFSHGPSYYGSGPVSRNVGPVQMSWSASPGSVFDYTGSFWLGVNGLWSSSRGGYAGVNNHDTMNFVFDKGISGIGGFMNYGIPNSTSTPNIPILNIYGANDVLLESFNLTLEAPISTPSRANAGAFRGFQRASADIFRLEIVNGLVIDDLVISYSAVSQVPLPAALPLFASGIGILALLAWRRKRPTTVPGVGWAPRPPLPQL